MKKLLLVAALFFITLFGGAKLHAEENNSHQVESNDITCITAVKDFLTKGEISFRIEKSEDKIVFYPMLFAVVSLLLMILAQIFFDKNYSLLPSIFLLVVFFCSVITGITAICVLNEKDIFPMIMALAMSFYLIFCIVDVEEMTSTNTKISVFFLCVFFLLFFLPVSFVLILLKGNMLGDTNGMSGLTIMSSFCFFIISFFTFYNLLYYEEGFKGYKKDMMVYITIKKKKKKKICKGYVAYFLMFYLVDAFHIISLLYT